MNAKNVKTVDDLFALSCAVCNCDDPDCGLTLYSHCHREDGVRVKFFKLTGVMQICCATCDTLIANFLIRPPGVTGDA